MVTTNSQIYLSGKNLYCSRAVESESVLDGATPCGYPARWGVTIIMVTQLAQGSNLHLKLGGGSLSS